MMLSVLTSSVLVSCSKDDETDDPIVGKWYFYAINNIKIVDCNKKSNIDILEDHTFIMSFVKDSDDNGTCENEKPFKGKWKKVKKGKYILSAKGGSKVELDMIFSLRNNNTELFANVEDNKELVCKKK